MKSHKPEIALLMLVILVSIGGFWQLFMGPDAEPGGVHYLHLVTSLLWLALLLVQLVNIERRRFSRHRDIGLAIFVMAPLIVATLAMLSVHSAARALVEAQADRLIVQNVMMTFELGLVVALAFALRKNRNLHGAFLMSSSLMFMGIALFFSLLAFVPQFRIEGPETFYRFGTAAATAGLVIAVIGAAFFFRNRRHGWPWLLVGLVFFINEAINALMRKYSGLQPLTELVGSFNENETFGVAWVGFLALLSLAWYAGKSKGAITETRSRQVGQ